MPRHISLGCLCLLLALLSFLSSALASLAIPPHHPRLHDEFAYLLQAETLASGRLTNPAHPLAVFFEHPHVLTEPTYNAKYQPGHALFIALGILVGSPIAGVWLENAAFIAALAWMLSVFLPRRWVLLGTVFAIIQLGLLNNWTQTYFTSPLAAAGGALVWGATFGLIRRRHRADAWLLGLGVVSLLFTRPFEGGLACLVPAGILLHHLCRRAHDASARPGLFREQLLPVALVVLAGLTCLLTYNRAVVGDALTPPYQTYEERFSREPLFAWQDPPGGPAPVFAHPFLAAYHADFVAPLSRVPRFNLDTWAARLRQTTVDNLGWLLCALALLAALRGFAPNSPRPSWGRLATASFAVCTTGFLLSVWFGRHYHAPILPVLLLLSVQGLRCLALSRPLRRISFAWITALALVAVSFAWSRDDRLGRTLRYYHQTTDRQHVADLLAQSPNPVLVIVQPEQPYPIHSTYVWNPPDIDQAHAVWAWDRGPAGNRPLLDYYPERKVMHLHVSRKKLVLVPYSRTSP